MKWKLVLSMGLLALGAVACNPPNPDTYGVRQLDREWMTVKSPITARCYEVFLGRSTSAPAVYGMAEISCAEHEKALQQYRLWPGSRIWVR